MGWCGGDALICADTVCLSRCVLDVLWLNVALALGIKAVCLVLAVFDDMGAYLRVVFNGLRLLRGGSSPSRAVPCCKAAGAGPSATRAV